MDKQKLQERAKGIFGHYPKSTEVFFTSDGSPFLTEQAAKSHAKSLKDKEVVAVAKQDIAAQEPGTPSAKPLDKLTVAELQAMAKEKGIEVPEKATKKEIVELLSAAE